VINPGALNYTLDGLTGAPVALAGLLARATDAHWDHRPDPERFTLREVLAHLADWEPIWLERAGKILSEEGATLPGYDPDAFAREHDYAGADVQESLEEYRRGRAALLARLPELSDAAWNRRGRHGELGPLPLYQLAQLILGHDVYHLRQVAEWLEAGE